MALRRHDPCGQLSVLPRGTVALQIRRLKPPSTCRSWLAPGSGRRTTGRSPGRRPTGRDDGRWGREPPPGPKAEDASSLDRLGEEERSLLKVVLKERGS